MHQPLPPLKKKGKWVTHPGDCHSPYYAAIISCLRTNRDDEPEAPTRWQQQHCYSPTLRDHFSMDLLFFFPFILSYLIISDFKPWDSLWELTYLTPFTISQTCVYLMANLVLLNLTLFLTVHFCAMHGYAATHMRTTHVMLLFHSATTMCLLHAFNLHYACPRQYQ